jgi:hypothetical protein
MIDAHKDIYETLYDEMEVIALFEHILADLSAQNRFIKVSSYAARVGS